MNINWWLNSSIDTQSIFKGLQVSVFLKLISRPPFGGLKSSTNFLEIFRQLVVRILKHLLRFGDFLHSVLDLGHSEIFSLLVLLDLVEDPHGILVQFNFNLSKHLFGIFSNCVCKSEKFIISRGSRSFFWALESNNCELIFCILKEILSISKGCLIDFAFFLVEELITSSFDFVISLTDFGNQEVEDNDHHHKLIEEPEHPDNRNSHTSFLLLVHWIHFFRVFNPNSVVNDSDITNRVSEDLEKDNNELWKSRVYFPLVFEICSHNLDNQAEKHHKNEKDSEERNEIKKDRGYHLDQESEVVNNSNVLHDLDNCLTHAQNRNDIVRNSSARIVFIVLLEVKVHHNMNHVHKRHGEIIQIPAHNVLLELGQPLLLDFAHF
jgi:hypothetical protein